MRLAQRWTWALLATLIGLSIVFLVALPAWADGGHHPDCERYPQKCTTTTTTTSTSTTTTLTEESSTTTIQSEETTSTTVGDTTTSTTLPASTTTVLTESTTTTALATSLTSQPPPSTDLTVAPADIELPSTGLSHDVWAGLTFAAFVLLTMGGMAVLAGRDDDE